MKKWEHSGKAELIPVYIDSKRYQTILADITELLYEYWSASSTSDFSSTGRKSI